MTPRKHAELIKAWADGAEIQYRYGNHWVDVSCPAWLDSDIYRLKPVPKPDFTLIGHAQFPETPIHIICKLYPVRVVVTFSGETGEAKKVEIVK